MDRTRSLVLGVFLLASPCLLASPAGTVKGTYTIKGKAYEAAYVYAVAKPDSFDKEKEGLEVLFTTAPVDEKELTSMMPGSGPRLSATLGADGSLYGIVFLFEGGSFSSSGTEQAFEKKAMDSSKVSGRLYSKKELEMGSEKGAFDLTFDAPVFRAKKVPPPSATERSTAAKSPQARAYEAYLKAIRAGDVAALKKSVTADVAKQMEAPDAKEMIEMVKAMTPKKVEYLRVTESGDTATLEAQSEDGKGTIDCSREKGVWKIGKQRWSSGS